MDRIDRFFSEDFAAIAQVVVFGLMSVISIAAAIFLAPWQWLIALISGIMLVSGIMECRRIEKRTTNNQ